MSQKAIYGGKVVDEPKIPGRLGDEGSSSRIWLEKRTRKKCFCQHREASQLAFISSKLMDNQGNMTLVCQYLSRGQPFYKGSSLHPQAVCSSSCHGVYWSYWTTLPNTYLTAMTKTTLSGLQIVLSLCLPLFAGASVSSTNTAAEVVAAAAAAAAAAGGGKPR
jgi:hypothetical protein